MLIGKIVSGGQTGVDRGALEAAFDLGFPYGGLIPKAIGMMHKKFRESVSRRQDHSLGTFREKLYRIELNRALLQELRVRVFDVADMEWLDFILMCRPSDGVPHDYDVVIGPTADDDTNRALKFYYDGTYGDPGSKEAKEMLLRVLETDKLGTQLYVGSQSVADRLVLKFESVDWREYA